MPIYDYECRKCGKGFIASQSILAKPLSKCPHCKRGPVRRLIGSGGGLIFKGTGFYITDYKKRNSSSPKSGSGSKPGGDSSGAKKDSGGGSSKSSGDAGSSKSDGGASASKPEKK